MATALPLRTRSPALTATMAPELVDLLRPSPFDVVKYYSPKAEREAIPQDSTILNATGVRLYASIITPFCLCYKYWDVDWRLVVPAIHRQGMDIKTAYRSTLGALLARIDAVKACAAGRADMSNVGQFLRRNPHILAATTSSFYFQVTALDCQSLLEACKKDLATAPLKKGIKYYVDKSLARNPPTGVNLKVLDTAERWIAVAEPSQPPAEPSASSKPGEDQKPTVPEPTASPPKASTSTITNPVPPATNNMVYTNAINEQVRAANSKAKRLETHRKRLQARSQTPRFAVRGSVAYPSTSIPSLPSTDSEWRCDNCGYKNDPPRVIQGVKREASAAAATDQGVKEETSAIGEAKKEVVPDKDNLPLEEKTEETCASCEEPRPKKSESDHTTARPNTEDVVKRTCTECQELLPEGLQQRDQTYNPTELKAHIRATHSDYAFAATWRDQHKKKVAGNVIWACPSKRCPWVNLRGAVEFENHLLEVHVMKTDKRLPARYLYPIAREMSARNARESYVNRLDVLEKRVYKEEEEALGQIQVDLAEFEKLVIESTGAGTDNTDNAEGESKVNERDSKQAMDVDATEEVKMVENVMHEAMVVDDVC